MITPRVLQAFCANIVSTRLTLTFAVLASLAVASHATAQDASPGTFNTNMLDIVGVTNSDVRYEPVDISEQSAVEQASVTSISDGIDPKASKELVELESRVAELNHEINVLRSKIRRPVSRQQVNAPRLFASFESMLLQPAHTNNTGLIVEVPDGYSHVMFPWQIEHSPRVSFGYDPGDESLGWRVRFWQFRHGERFVANADNGLLPTGFEGTVGFLSEDGDITTGLAFIEEGEFHSHIRTDVIDWEVQRRLNDAINLYAGLRYAKVLSEYAALTDRGTAHSHAQFRGFGPTIALQFEHRLPLDRLMLFSGLRGSILFGQQEFRAVDDVNNLTQSINAIDLRSGDEGADSVATNAEVQFGIQYDIADWIAFRVALEAQTYGNVGSANPTGVFTGPDSGLSGDSPLDDSLSLFGLSVATEIRL
ncbi:Lpg1974 family pore-forming outer membrane protein [Stieleria varia]|uniref:Uncharacterized protein n=1 Tax=Stieleria varia TaxID=2528005 RepID=A0A5C6ARC9_9BACT|nr:Lpg1974 family pore-forming outer membrane protein [Stieleria varia]TWU02118.1 hypothetical protein Pla52n_31670 [Stieleria varia]